MTGEATLGLDVGTTAEYVGVLEATGYFTVRQTVGWVAFVKYVGRGICGNEHKWLAPVLRGDNLLTIL